MLDIRKFHHYNISKFHHIEEIMNFPIYFNSECSIQDEKLRAYLLDRLILDSDYAEEKKPRELSKAIERIHTSLANDVSDLLWTVMCEEACLLPQLIAGNPFVRLELDQRVEEQLRQTQTEEACPQPQSAPLYGQIHERNRQKFLFLEQQILKSGLFERSKSYELKRKSEQLRQIAGDRWAEWAGLLEAQRTVYVKIIAELPFLRIVL